MRKSLSCLKGQVNVTARILITFNSKLSTEEGINEETNSLEGNIEKNEEENDLAMEQDLEDGCENHQKDKRNIQMESSFGAAMICLQLQEFLAFKSCPILV